MVPTLYVFNISFRIIARLAGHLLLEKNVLEDVAQREHT